MLEQASEIKPSMQCSHLLAQAYQRIGKLNEAIIEYKKLDLSQLQNKMIPFNLGLCLVRTGSNTDAIKAFELAIKMDNSFLEAWGNIGYALKNEGRYNEALTAIQKCLELDPNNPTTYMSLGLIYKDLGNLDQALASTLKSLELDLIIPTPISIGQNLQGLGNLDQALASTLKSLELKPDNHNAYITWAASTKISATLIRLYSTLKSLDSNSKHCPHEPGQHLQRPKNLDQALSPTLKSIELKPQCHGAHEPGWYLQRSR